MTVKELIKYLKKLPDYNVVLQTQFDLFSIEGRHIISHNDGKIYFRIDKYESTKANWMASRHTC